MLTGEIRAVIPGHPVTNNDPDLNRIGALIAALAGDPDEALYVVIPWEPASKARPRFGKNGRAFTPKESREAEARTAAHLARNIIEPMTGNACLVAIFYRSTRQRIDTDNMLKHVCDAANGILWDDDSQVTATLGITELDEDNPRTLIGFAPHMSTMTRGTDATYPCAQCGRPISLVGRSSRKKTCSPECAARIRGFELLEVPVPCAECGEPFRRTTRAQRLCSPECRADRIRGVRKANARALSECLDCGKTLAHHRGGRCRECWRASVAVES